MRISSVESRRRGSGYGVLRLISNRRHSDGKPSPRNVDRLAGNARRNNSNRRKPGNNVPRLNRAEPLRRTNANGFAVRLRNSNHKDVLPHVVRRFADPLPRRNNGDNVLRSSVRRNHRLRKQNPKKSNLRQCNPNGNPLIPWNI